MPESEIDIHAVTYERFMLLVKWFSLHLAALITFLVLWFATPAGFGWALIVGLLIFGAGVWAINRGKGVSGEAKALSESTHA